MKKESLYKEPASMGATILLIVLMLLSAIAAVAYCVLEYLSLLPGK